MVVLQHVLVRLQIELGVVLRVLAKADSSILVDDSADFDHAASCQLTVVLVPNDFDFLAYKSRLLVRQKIYLRSIVVMMRQFSSIRSIFPTKAIVRPTKLIMCGTPTNGCGSRCTFLTSSVIKLD